MTHSVDASTLSQKIPDGGSGMKRRGKLDITSYTNAGETPDAGKFGMARIDHLTVLEPVSDNGHLWRFDGTKVRAMKIDTSEGTATFTATDGNAIVTERWGNVKAGEFGNQATGSNTTAAAGTEDIIALVTATTAAKSTIVAEPDYPRNVVVELESTIGGTLPADCGTATIAGTGPDDAALTEVIALSPLNDVVMSAGANLWVCGVKVFKTVTSLTLSVDLTASVADALVGLGGGTKLWLQKTLDTPAEADVKRVLKNDAQVAAATYVADTTYNAVDLGADLADNDDVVIQYATDSDAAGGSITTAGSAKADVEASSTTDVGATWVEVIGR